MATKYRINDFVDAFKRTGAMPMRNIFWGDNKHTAACAVGAYCVDKFGGVESAKLETCEWDAKEIADILGIRQIDVENIENGFDGAEPRIGSDFQSTEYWRLGKKIFTEAGKISRN